MVKLFNGIPAEKTAHIFGEFNQVQNERNRQFDGTGLGLAISQRLIALMDGDIWVESVENAGSKFGFSVDLPPAGLAQNMPPGPVIKPAQILILEGHTQKRGILQRQLSRMDHNAIAPESAKGIWPALSPHTDLVFIGTAFPDVALPQMIDDLRATAPDLRIVRITQGPGVEPVEAITHRVDTVLQEPLTARDLLRLIAQLAPNQSLQISEHPHFDEAFDTPSSSRALRVLAVEDNKTNQLVLNKMLNHLDLDLRFASNGEEAVALFHTFQPDLIFMDISMPIMDGKDATRAIRALEGPLGTRTPIIALTAHAMDGDDAAILEAGLDHYLSKPLRRDALITHIEAIRPQGVRPVTMVQAG